MRKSIEKKLINWQNIFNMSVVGCNDGYMKNINRLILGKKRRKIEENSIDKYSKYRDIIVDNGM